MSWTDALELVVAATGHERYRWLCSEDNPDPGSRDGYRGLMVRLSAGDEAAPSAPTPEDLALRAHVAKHGCCPG
jgi:hypothetical protein